MENSIGAHQVAIVSRRYDQGVRQPGANGLRHLVDEGLTRQRSEAKTLFSVVPKNEADRSMAETALTVVEDRLGARRHSIQR